MLASRTWLTDNSLLFIQLSVLIVEVWLSFKRHHMRFREWLFEPIWLIQRTWSRFVLFPCEIQKHWLYAMTELMEKSQSSSKLVCRSQMASTSNRQFKSNEDSWIENRFSSEVHIRNQRFSFNQRFVHSLVRQFSSIWRGARTFRGNSRFYFVSTTTTFLFINHGGPR